MIKKTVLFSMLLFVLYNAAILVIDPNFYIPQNQFQQNVIKGEEYLYSSRAKNYVIVGSSLSTKMDMNLLPDSFFNLSFRGQSIYEGLEIIKRSDTKPRVVFIETNRYFKNIDSSFHKELFSPSLYTLREDIPSLQEKNRPVNLLTFLTCQVVESVSKGFADKIKAKLGIKFKTVALNQSFHFPEGMNEGISKVLPRPSKEIVETQLREHHVLIEKDTLNQRIALLKSYVKYLQEQRIEIVFFEMPIQQELWSAPRSTFLREELLRKFPKTSYMYIHLPDCSYFTTRDGVHLMDESAKLYTQYFYQEVSKCLKEIKSE